MRRLSVAGGAKLTGRSDLDSITVHWGSFLRDVFGFETFNTLARSFLLTNAHLPVTESLGAKVLPPI